MTGTDTKRRLASDASRAAGRAYGIVRGPLGRRAAADGWVSWLWDFVFAYGREPDPAEQSALRDKADALWANLDDWKFESARNAVRGRFERLRRIANER